MWPGLNFGNLEGEGLEVKVRMRLADFTSLEASFWRVCESTGWRLVDSFFY